jgi:hypothetical protein
MTPHLPLCGDWRKPDGKSDLRTFTTEPALSPRTARRGKVLGLFTFHPEPIIDSFAKGRHTLRVGKTAGHDTGATNDTGCWHNSTIRVG